MTNTDKERADFEAWWSKVGLAMRMDYPTARAAYFSGREAERAEAVTDAAPVRGADYIDGLEQQLAAFVMGGHPVTLQFPTMLRKMWSGEEVQAWLNNLPTMYTHPEPSPDVDYFASLVGRARTAAAKATAKFPQPNYVTLKIAEEAGEVVRGAVHFAEGRMPWDEVEGEIVQLLAMLIRFVTEGDQINGVTPPVLTKPEKKP